MTFQFSQYPVQRLQSPAGSLAIWPIPLLPGAVRSSHERLRFVADYGRYRRRPLSGHFDALEASIEAPARPHHHGDSLDLGLDGSPALRSLQRGRPHFHL